MNIALSIIAKKNYYLEIIHFVLFVFFNKNVDNSVDKWNNSRLKSLESTSLFADFSAF